MDGNAAKPSSKDTSQFNENYIKDYNEESDEEYFLEEYFLFIKFNQNAGLKPYIDINTDLRKKVKKDFFKLINNKVFGKTMENVRKHREIKIVTTERRRNYLVSQPSYHTTKIFTENL